MRRNLNSSHLNVWFVNFFAPPKSLAHSHFILHFGFEILTTREKNEDEVEEEEDKQSENGANVVWVCK